MEINLAAQSKSTWRDFMHLAFLTKLSFSFFSHGALLKIILFCNLNVIFLGYCEGLTGSICCIVILLTHYPTTTSGTSKRSYGYHFLFRVLFPVSAIQPHTLRWCLGNSRMKFQSWVCHGGLKQTFSCTCHGACVFTSSSYLSCGRQDFHVKMHLCSSWSKAAVQNSITFSPLIVILHILKCLVWTFLPIQEVKKLNQVS